MPRCRRWPTRCSAALRLEVDAKRAPLFGRLAGAAPAYRAAVVKMLAAGTVTPQAGEILRQAAVDASADPQTRATALSALATATGTGALERAIEGFASRQCRCAGRQSRARQRLAPVRERGHARAEHRHVPRADGVDRHVEADSRLCRAAAARRGARCRRARTRGGGGGGGVGGRGGPSAAAIENARAAARKDIEAAWQGPSVASLLRAIGATEASGLPRPHPALRSRATCTGRSRGRRLRGDALARGDDDGRAPRSCRRYRSRNCRRVSAR